MDFVYVLCSYLFDGDHLKQLDTLFVTLMKEHGMLFHQRFLFRFAFIGFTYEKPPAIGQPNRLSLLLVCPAAKAKSSGCFASSVEGKDRPSLSEAPPAERFKRAFSAFLMSSCGG
ncbi:hypothetical protein LC040_09195 [Bacillus tianshenii]|nr:hypothetical protein LC040_09195 [Bacillus tianshenii]